MSDSAAPQPDLLARIDRLESLDAIRQLAAKYSLALDMRDAQRAYEASLNVIEASRDMQSRTLDLLKK